VTQTIIFDKYIFIINLITFIKKCTIIGTIIPLIVLKYLTPKHLVICIYISFWATLLVLHQRLKSLQAQLEPLLDLIDILVEIH
jgi:hypothetical protein